MIIVALLAVLAGMVCLGAVAAVFGGAAIGALAIVAVAAVIFWVNQAGPIILIGAGAWALWALWRCLPKSY